MGACVGVVVSLSESVGVCVRVWESSCLRMICNKAFLESGFRVRGGGGEWGVSESSQHCLNVLQGRGEGTDRGEERKEK